jgi:cyclase
MKNGVVVQSKGFKRYQRLGNPITIVQRLSDWAADELIYLDISREAVYDLGREDLNFDNPHNILGILNNVAKTSFMPLTFGGRIRTLEEVSLRIHAGADKVSINSEAVRNPEFITQCSEEFGSQCIVVSIDAFEKATGEWEVYIDGGRTPTSRSPAIWAKEAEKRGAGEIFLNSINRDGTGIGYDIPLVKSVIDAVTIPVIVCGGVGKWDHLAEGIIKAGATAVAAANIFHYTENSVFEAKKYLYEKDLNVRKPILGYCKKNNEFALLQKMSRSLDGC